MKTIRKTIGQLRNKLYRALRWSEKYVKTDMVYLFKGGSWLTSYHIVSAAIAFLLAVGFANFLPKSAYGTYKYILAVSGVLSAFSLTGMSTAVVRASAQGLDGTLKSGFFANLRWSFLVFLGGVAAAFYYYIHDNTTLALGILIAASFSPLIQSAALYAAFLRGKKDFRRKTLYGIFQTVVPALALLGTIALTDNPLLVVAVSFLANAAIVFILYWRTFSVYHPSGPDDPHALSYGRHLSVIAGIGKIAGNLDTILAWHFLGAAPLAVYAFAIAPVNQLLASKKIVKALALPKMSTRSFQELQRSVPRKALLFFAYSAVIVMLYIISAPFIYNEIFSQYQGSVLYSQLYALSLLFAPVVLFSDTLVAHKKKKEMYFIGVSNSIIKIGLLAILLPFYGILGLIAALLISKVLNAILTIFFVMRPFSA